MHRRRAQFGQEAGKNFFFTEGLAHFAVAE
jgi:hypothetical protein